MLELTRYQDEVDKVYGPVTWADERKARIQTIDPFIKSAVREGWRWSSPDNNGWTFKRKQRLGGTVDVQEQLTIDISRASIIRRDTIRGRVLEIVPVTMESRLGSIDGSEDMMLELHTGLVGLEPGDTGRTVRTHQVIYTGSSLNYGGSVLIADEKPNGDRHREKIKFSLPPEDKMLPRRLPSTDWLFMYDSAKDSPIELSESLETKGLLERLYELFGLNLLGTMRSQLAISARQRVDTSIVRSGQPIHPALRV